MEAGLMDYFTGGMKGMGTGRSSSGAGEDEMRKQKMAQGLSDAGNVGTPSIMSAPKPVAMQSQETAPMEFGNAMGDSRYEALKRLSR
jgi:hypothetical protein